MMLNITPPKYSMQETIDSPQTSVPKPSAFKQSQESLTQVKQVSISPNKASTKPINKNYRRSLTMAEQLVSGMKNRLLAAGHGVETNSVISKDIDKMIEA